MEIISNWELQIVTEIVTGRKNYIRIAVNGSKMGSSRKNCKKECSCA
jgi:hypothetical protein